MLRQQEERRHSPWSSTVLLATAVVLAVAGAVLLLAQWVYDASVGAPLPPTTAPLVEPASGRETTDASARRSPLERTEAIHEYAPRSVASGPPVRVRVQAIGVDAPVVPLGLDVAGRLEVPDDFSAAGWWQGGAQPAQQGPTVLVGHVDSYQGPAVFYRLADLEVGDEVVVTLDGDESLSYRVTGIHRAPKNGFPTEAVYSHTPGSTLRLITCGGPFDQTTRHYRDSVIVFADLS